MTGSLTLGVQTGYWTAKPKLDVVGVAQEAERLGYDTVWTGESYSSDAFGPLFWVGAHTERIKLGTGIAQLSARTPAALAMQAMTLDHLSGGRHVLGVGVSGPQVVEGWYGEPFGRPLARTREYIDIVRTILRREGPVTAPGPHYPLPYPADAPGSTGLGKPIKLITTPWRADLPIYLGAEGPKNVALAAELCQGWLPLYYAPTRPEVYADSLAGAPSDFEIAVNVNVTICDDVEVGLWPTKGTLGFYIGGMGAKSKNFHTELMARMGYEAEALQIQELFFEGKRDEAVMAVPSSFADEISLVGPIERIRDRLEAWRESAVTQIIIGSGDPHTLRTMAELTL